jgi:hypothetical protein
MGMLTLPNGFWAGHGSPMPSYKNLSGDIQYLSDKSG